MIGKFGELSYHMKNTARKQLLFYGLHLISVLTEESFKPVLPLQSQPVR